MKKIILLILLSLFALFPAFMMAQGEVSVTKKLSVIKTEYFDFIFPEESEPTAQHLAQQADDIYRKATAFLNVESTRRFPVVVTPETDQLNAYFVFDAYGRIVIFDTVPSESLAVFSDTLASVFYHEVVHAISLNIKSPFWDALSVVFGDIPSLFTVLNVPKSLIEGTAVLAESLDGEGRLNSAYSIHVIKQAKIEGKFPDWRDITGAYQLFTSGSLPYIFGGAFSNYLYQKYGMEKFADFWNQNSKFNFTLYEGAFEKVYARSLDEVWQEFEDSIYISPLASAVQPFFSQEPLSSDLAPGAYLYHNLTSSPDGIVWQDGFSGTVRFLPNEAENQKLKTLYTTDLTSRLHFSRDGKYLVSSGFTGGSKDKNTVRVYDMERQKNILIQKDLRDGAILIIPKNTAVGSSLNGVSTVLAGIQTDAALASLVLYDMDALQSSANSEPLVTIPFERNVFLFEPVDAGNGVLVALMYNLGDWQFFVYDCITGTQRIYEVDEQFQNPSGIQDIYASDTKLYMSYAQDVSSQPVLAYVNLVDFSDETLTLHRQTDQVSGGVFDPVVVSNAAQGENAQIAYLSFYYENRALSTLSIESGDLFETLTFNTHAPNTTTVVAIDYPIEPYRPSEYMDKGVLLPLIGSMNLNPFIGFLPQNFSVGATAYTIDPAGRFLVTGGAGYDWTDKNFTTALSTMFTENYFTAATDTFAAFSFAQLETFATKLSTNITIPIISGFNSIQFANALSWFYLAEQNEYLLEGHTLHDIAEISFTHLRPTGQFLYDRLGFTFGTQLAVQKQFSQNKATPDIEGALFLGLQTPQLLPFKNPNRFAVNLPGMVIGYRYFNSEKTWEVQSNFVLFAYDVQKPITFAPLFVQRLTLDAGLDCMWHKSGDPEMTLHGSLFATFSLNTGYATVLPIDLGVAFTWQPHIAGADGLDVSLKFALSL